MTAKDDFYKDGGKISNIGRRGKILCVCIGCGEREYLHQRVFDRASKPHCSRCGWTLERSVAAHNKAIKAVEARGAEGESGSIRRQAKH